MMQDRSTESVQRDLSVESPRGDSASRWMLNRAGIINVYQYGNETLHFGGGRLLLRGVNGSGKSTAMNMLLPFLLDADIRRIDAAGEQSSVLRSWMLSGRDEPQPQGYLWLELRNGDEYLSFGCGIRANRSTERVSTWWFITPRRPGIDLHLVEGRVPLNADALRVVIEPGAVYGHDQRAAYRAELRSRLFGGADLEQHLHLLRIVRNPRVGDRLDAELPRYLEDALPQLSEAALENAAQPLEDLEEHRRNVSDLQITADTLTALRGVYGNYARTELHRIATRMIELSAGRDRLHRAEMRLHKTCDAAGQRLGQAKAAKSRHEQEVNQLRTAIGALEASDAYKSGAQLNDLRSHVASLERGVASAKSAAGRGHLASDRAVDAVQRARSEAIADHEAGRKRLSALAALTSSCRLVARPPTMPSIPQSSESEDASGTPIELIDTAKPMTQLAILRSAAQHRHGDVQTVSDAVLAIDPAEQSLRADEQKLSDAQGMLAEAQTELTEALSSYHSSITNWKDEALGWIGDLREYNDAHGLDTIDPPPEIDDPAGTVAMRRSILAPLQELVDRTVQRQQERRALLDARLASQNEIVAEMEARVAELAAKQLPDPPVQPWQHRSVHICLAEMIEFADGVDEESRAGLESAMEAAGLLAAEVHGNGVLRLADGQLMALPSDHDAPSPLSRMLRVKMPDQYRGLVTLDTVQRILLGISTDLEANRGHTVVATTGEFRIGALRGRHRKAEAEHIGLTARRDTLERQRAEAHQAFVVTREERDRLVHQVDATKEAINEGRRLRSLIPPDHDVRMAYAHREEVQRQVGEAERRVDNRRSEMVAAEKAYAEIVDHAKRTAAQAALPSTLAELESIRTDLGSIIRGCGESQDALIRFAAAVQSWRDRGDDWAAAREDQLSSEADLELAVEERDREQARLTTLEDSIGLEYEKVVAEIGRKRRVLEEAQQRLKDAGKEHDAAIGDLATTRQQHENAIRECKVAEGSCLAALPVLQRTLSVPGLVDAARTPADFEQRSPSEINGSEEPDDRVVFPTVEEHPDGLRVLAQAIQAVIPTPETEITPEGVRQSLRQRRDNLGAGWDAEDRQPNDELPLHVEVTGPIAPQIPLPEATTAVLRQLATMKSLLSAKQDQALRNLLQGLVAREVAAKLHAAGELIARMNQRLSAISTSQGIGVTLRWRRRDDLDPDIAGTVELLGKPPDLRTAEEDRTLSDALGRRIDDARRDEPELPYRELISQVLDYRSWHRMSILLRRPGRPDERLSRRTALSEGEKKIASSAEFVGSPKACAHISN